MSTKFFPQHPKLTIEKAGDPTWENDISFTLAVFIFYDLQAVSTQNNNMKASSHSVNIS